MAKVKMDDEYFEEESKRFHSMGGNAINDDGAVALTEAILDGICIEMKHLSKAYNSNPTNNGILSAIRKLDKLLASRYFNILTMGHGAEIHAKFREECGVPEGVDFGECSRKNA